MELRQLRYFLAVAEVESFTGAARRLHLAQPALSQQVRALEDELGVKLLERGARRSRLTESGSRLAARARRIFLEVEGTREDMAALGAGRRGTVRFGSALQTLTEGRLPSLLVQFRRRAPEIDIVFREAHTAPLLDLLAQGRLDMALVHLGRGEGTPALRVDFDLAALEIERLYEEPLVVVVGRRHRLARRTNVRLEELAGEEFVSFGPGSTVRALLAQAARRTGFQPRAAISAVNLGTVRALVSAGLGVAVLPRSALTLPGPPLRALRLTDPTLARVVALARNTIRYQSPATRAFAQFLRERLPA
ncbi:MAG TPA: LysR family transcriptional regulator [Haliangiales bacterium]|nr:LysR family transcriptional regulator [Haliangiales bacterium]